MDDKQTLFGEIAGKIADDLFGESDRLVLSNGDDDRGRPGWSKQVVIDRITDTLADSGI